MSEISSLQKCLLIMNYNSSQTLSENISEILKEQNYIPNSSGGYTLKMEPVSMMFNPIPASEIFPEVEKSKLPTELDKSFNAKKGMTPPKSSKYGGVEKKNVTKSDLFTNKVKELPSDKTQVVINKPVGKKGEVNPYNIETMGGGKQEIVRISTSEVLSDLILPNWNDSHSVLQWVELTTGVLGMVLSPTPIGWALLGISTIAGIADASKYAMEGDPYTATIYFALSIIPAGELAAGLKGNPAFRKLGVQGVKTAIELVKTGKISKPTLELLKDVYRSFKTNAPEINKLTKKNIIKRSLSSLKTKTPKVILDFYGLLHKLKIINLSKLFINVLGYPIAADLIYVWINRDLMDNKMNMLIREKNDLLKMWRYLRMKHMEGFTDQEIASLLNEQLSEMTEKAIIESDVDLTEEIKNIPKPEERKQLFDEFKKNYQ